MYKKDSSSPLKSPRQTRADSKHDKSIKQDVEEYETVLEKSFEICDKKGGESDWVSLRVMGKLPPKRANHTLSVYDDKLILFGGVDIKDDHFSDLWELPIDCIDKVLKNEAESHEMTWRRKTPTGKDIPGRMSHHAVAIDSVHGHMYLYGGIHELQNDPKAIFRLSLAGPGKWEQLIIRSGVYPPSRDDHTMVYLNNTLMIFGGFLESGPTNEVISLQVLQESPNLEWSFIHPHDPDKVDAPSPRAAHTAVSYGGSMWIFAGIDNDNNRLNDLWSLNLESYIWTHIQVPMSPTVRNYHSATVMNDQMIVFGGLEDNNRELNDVYIYKFKEESWILKFESVIEPTANQSFLSTSPRRYSPNRSPKNKSPSPTSSSGIPHSAQTDFYKSPKSRPQTQIPAKKRGGKKTEKTNKTQKIPKGSPGIRSKTPIRGSPGSPKRNKRAQTAMIGKSGQKRNTIGYKALREEMIGSEGNLSPTTMQMLNSGIIKAADRGFEMAYQQYRKKKAKMRDTLGIGKETRFGGIRGRVPAARSGHQSSAFGQYLFIFGGDRRQMPFNDLFLLSMATHTLKLPNP